VLVAEATHEPHVLVVVAHGWNIDEALPWWCSTLVRPLWVGAWRVPAWWFDKHTVGS